MRILVFAMLLLTLSACSSHQSSNTPPEASRVNLAKYDALGLTAVGSFSKFYSVRYRWLDDNAFIAEAPSGHTLLLVVDGYNRRNAGDFIGQVGFVADGDTVVPTQSKVEYWDKAHNYRKGSRPLLAAYQINWRGEELDVVDVIMHGKDVEIRHRPPVASH